ncbi:MAG: hypothetical protein K0S61_3810 [Anaerocolumna sp.]|jgi:flagellar protein FlaG|nr:hypothetical protein [Anaerocolumna sp.]
MEVVKLKISATGNYMDSKTAIKEQEVNQTTNMLLTTGAKDSVSIATNKNLDAHGEGASKRDAQAEKKRLISLIDDTNNKLKGIRRRCEYSYNDEVNRIAIKVVDADTEKVIKEIPPEEALETIQKLWEVAGILVDEKR